MAADGSIVIETNIDNKKAQKELNQLAKKIQSLEDQLTSKKQGRFPLVENLNVVNAELEEARKQLSMLEQNAINVAMKAGSSADDYMRAYSDRPMVDSKLKKQQEKVDAIEKEWRQAEKALSDYDSKISGLEGKLNLAKEEAGGLQQNMAKSGPAAAKMAKSVDRAQKSASKFSSRMREVIRSALVFTVITQALAKFREWMGKVIKTNDEARASIARLKGALLTLAQPMIEVIIPAFTNFVDMLARIISMAARITAALFGTTAEKAADSAENLYEETEALEKTGEAAEEAGKSLASFDEINQLSGSRNKSESSNQDIGPDFSAFQEGMNSGWLQEMMASVSAWVPIALMLGGIALVAIGASIGSLVLVLSGLLLLGAGIDFSGENEQLQSWVDALGLNSVQEFVLLAIILGGIAMVAIGASTVNILLVVAGLALIGVAVAYAYQSGMMQDWAEALGLSRAAQFITAALLIAGFALICIGAGLGNILMVISGIALIATGVFVGSESGVFESWAKTLGLDSAFDYVTAAMQIAGFALICIGAAMGNIFMVIAGAVLLGAGVTAEVIGEQTLMAWWEKLKLTTVVQWVSVAILLVGIVMVAIAAATGNLILLIAGAVVLGLGIVAAINDDHLQDWVETLGLEKVMEYVTIAILLVGIGLVAIGLMTMNILMFLGGCALLIAGFVVGNESGTFRSWVETLHLEEVAGWVSTAMLLAGIALVAIGAMTLNPLFILAGIALLGGGTALKLGSGSTKGSSYSARSGLGRMSVPRLSIDDVPALAKGAVIPPNKEFLAVLGDQKSGTNIEAPTSEIEAAVARGMQRYGGGGSNIAILEIDKQVLGRVSYQATQSEVQRIGVNLVEG